MVYIGDVHSKPLVTGVVSDINCTHLEASTVLFFCWGKDKPASARTSFALCVCGVNKNIKWSNILSIEK